MTGRFRRTLMLLATLLACVAGCTTQRTKGTLEQFEQYAGPPVDSFTYLTHSYDFTPVGPLQLVFWPTINDAYLITVRAPCPGLAFARAARLTQTANTVTTGVDMVQFQDQSCFIKEIRPVNYLKMKQELHTGP